jgi:hypothetical protein
VRSASFLSTNKPAVMHTQSGAPLDTTTRENEMVAKVRQRAFRILLPTDTERELFTENIGPCTDVAGAVGICAVIAHS